MVKEMNHHYVSRNAEITAATAVLTVPQPQLPHLTQRYYLTNIVGSISRNINTRGAELKAPQPDRAVTKEQ